VLKQRTLKILLGLALGYALLTIPLYVSPAYADSAASLLVLIPVLSIYLFHKIGIPGLLEHNGLCGWGWCSPTPLGYVFLLAFWLGFALLVAWGIAALTLRISHRKDSL
jgi:hypothetical protein